MPVPSFPLSSLLYPKWSFSVAKLIVLYLKPFSGSPLLQIKHSSLKWYRTFSMIWPLIFSWVLSQPVLWAPVAMSVFWVLKGHLADSYLCFRSHCRHHLLRKLSLTHQVWVWPSSFVFSLHPEISMAHIPLHPGRMDVWMDWALMEVCDIGQREFRV